MKLDQQDILDLPRFAELICTLGSKSGRDYVSEAEARLDAKYFLTMPDDYVRVIWAAGVRERLSYATANIRMFELGLKGVGRPEKLAVRYFRHWLIHNFWGLAPSSGPGGKYEGNAECVMNDLTALLDGETYYPLDGVGVARYYDPREKKKFYFFVRGSDWLADSDVFDEQNPEKMAEDPLWDDGGRTQGLINPGAVPHLCISKLKERGYELSESYTRESLIVSPIKAALSELKAMLAIARQIL